MTLVYSASIASLPSIAMADTEFDTLELRGRSVTETLSPLEDLGQDNKVGVCEKCFLLCFETN